ncbi:MAG TPA: radical SAM protein [Pyrinomonadaceae bacterium]|nr:radical SAM protein [Pyrinomonadaceae bacterium]
MNCFFDDSRLPARRTTKFPQAMGPVFLAGAFDIECCEVRLYNEVDSGPLTDEATLEWPDMLVLTGLTNTFDRMLHLTAYARTKNPRVIVVAGGPTIRALPLLAERFFDYCCLGDIEELREVIVAAWGKEFLAEEMLPRYDLAYWMRRMGYAETTRYCNFHCSFCSLTGEGRGYQTYPLEYLRRQVLALGRRKHVLFIDNNFYGSDRGHFLARMELIAEMREAGYLKNWGALVTSDFFHRDENLKLARGAGCELLFCGVESFDTEWLLGAHKTQNTNVSQVELIRKSLEAGIVLVYGLMLDLAHRTIADLRREIEFITGTPEITLPSFVTLPVPLLGTPLFSELAAKGAFLPSTKLRDMDGSTLVLTPMDPIHQAVAFLREMLSLRGYRRRVLNHSWHFLQRYRARLTRVQLLFSLTNAALLCAYSFATSPTQLAAPSAKGRRRTHVSTTEILDSVYTPAFRVDSRYEHYFKPTMVTDGAGNLSKEMLDSGLLKQIDRQQPKAVSA